MEELSLDELKKKTIKELLKTPLAESRSGDTELAVKCPRCSHLHPNSGPHFYISTTTDVFMYDCKHCSMSGVLTYGLLNEMGIFDTDIEKYLTLINKKNIKKIGGRIARDKNNYELLDKYNQIDEFKLDYMSNRTSINFYDKENRQKYGVITNLKDFFDHNNIDIKTINPKPGFESYIEELSLNGVGFLSYNQNIVNIKLISSQKINSRYIMLKINKSISAPFLYIPHKEIDVLSETPKIVVAEGAFDIICIEQRFYPLDDTNTILAAVGSLGSYKKSIKSLITMTGFIGADLDIYSDAEVNLKEYEKFLAEDRELIGRIRVFYNKYNKDFGNMNEKYKKITKIVK